MARKYGTICCAAQINYLTLVCRHASWLRTDPVQEQAIDVDAAQREELKKAAVD